MVIGSLVVHDRVIGVVVAHVHAGGHAGHVVTAASIVLLDTNL